LTRAKISRIQAPILFLQGSEFGGINRFNTLVTVPELRAAHKSVEAKTLGGRLTDAPLAVRTPRPEVALKAFRDADEFFRRYLKTQPKEIPAAQLSYVGVPQQ
jgi:hypothetical protein